MFVTLLSTNASHTPSVVHAQSAHSTQNARDSTKKSH